jgi:hypothetical protein
MSGFIFHAGAFYCPFVELVQATLKSPGELRVFDSVGRVTGLVDGKVVNEIPLSDYADNTVTLSFPKDSYSYEAVGTTKGAYGLMVTAVTQEGNITFVANDIPILSNEVHQYTIDWVALSQSEKGTVVATDSDGDGEFEWNVTAGIRLTPEELTLAIGMTDMNKDRVVNIIDISIVSKAYGSKPSDPIWNAVADLDKNGTVNIVDISIVAKDYGKIV